MPWNVVEVSPGKFVWDDYATMLDLAARHGIRVVLAEMLVDFPEWLIAAHPEARIEMASGQKRQSEMHISSVNGGHHALCLNHPAVSETAERFLTAMANRFRGHPALLGYDIWNECTQYVAERLCFCSACPCVTLRLCAFRGVCRRCRTGRINGSHEWRCYCCDHVARKRRGQALI